MEWKVKLRMVNGYEQLIKFTHLSVLYFWYNYTVHI